MHFGVVGIQRERYRGEIHRRACTLHSIAHAQTSLLRQRDASQKTPAVRPVSGGLQVPSTFVGSGKGRRFGSKPPR